MEKLIAFFKRHYEKRVKNSCNYFLVVFIIDQIVKYGFANFNLDVDGPYMSLKLAYNYGVAFFYVFIFRT